MKYLWINPVTDKMYDKQKLNEFIMQQGYKRVETSKDWLSVVKEKYKKAVQDSENTVIDIRCPMAADLVKNLADTKEFVFPEIHPILIHCGCELAEREMTKDDELIITTPCKALAELGNKLALKNTTFIPWNQFLRKFNEKPGEMIESKTPIPLGFFEELKVNTVSLTGEQEIQEYFQSDFGKEIQLIEMLYCKDGCHNGDGIKNES